MSKCVLIGIGKRVTVETDSHNRCESKEKDPVLRLCFVQAME